MLGLAIAGLLTNVASLGAQVSEAEKQADIQDEAKKQTEALNEAKQKERSRKASNAARIQQAKIQQEAMNRRLGLTGLATQASGIVSGGAATQIAADNAAMAIETRNLELRQKLVDSMANQALTNVFQSVGASMFEAGKDKLFK